MKQKVILAFQTIHQLWAFVQAVHIYSMEISTRCKTLTCECGGYEIEVAEEKYGGKLLQPLKK